MPFVLDLPPKSLDTQSAGTKQQLGLSHSCRPRRNARKMSVQSFYLVHMAMCDLRLQFLWKAYCSEASKNELVANVFFFLDL